MDEMLVPTQIIDILEENRLKGEWGLWLERLMRLHPEMDKEWLWEESLHRMGYAVTEKGASGEWLRIEEIEAPKLAGWRRAKSTRKEQQAGTWEGLALLASGRRANQRQVIEWVFEHVDVPLQGIDPDDVPSSGSVSLLKWVKETESNRNMFMSQIWPKTMPSRSEVDQMEKVMDDGGAVLDLVDRLRRGIEDEITNDVADE